MRHSISLHIHVNPFSLSTADIASASITLHTNDNNDNNKVDEFYCFTYFYRSAIVDLWERKIVVKHSTANVCAHFVLGQGSFIILSHFGLPRIFLTRKSLVSILTHQVAWRRWNVKQWLKIVCSFSTDSALFSSNRLVTWMNVGAASTYWSLCRRH